MMQKKLIIKPQLGSILKERKMTQSQLSEKTGIAQGTISRFDGNSRHEDIHLFLISRELELPIEELFKVIEVEESDEA
ncbi:helix-turn-helix domain-containing protein [Brevibacillus formosus]|uniref:helix-turn-helix domain-containing protein n=1 Tax=Brevibacillus formosus TaxID=54913 RepID=UPI00215584F7|nr:helix-turn-helix transcriptional regulator [Brevibacillus formosus]